MKLKVLVNASTLVIGGGVQVGVSLIEYLFRNPSNEFNFLFLVSEAIHKNLSNQIKLSDNIRVISGSPAKIFSGKTSRSEITKIESNFRPHIVYSLGFPSYTKFKTPEIGRYTNPWEIFSAREAWSLLSIKSKIFMWLKIRYRIFWAKKANFIETQTETAKDSIVSVLKIDKSKVKVISNSVNDVFLNNSHFSKNKYEKSKYNIFCLAAPYIHKNLECIPKVAKHLSEISSDIKFEFILTLPAKSQIWKNIENQAIELGTLKFIRNIGPLEIKNCVSWYKKSHIIFLPTLLEIFSATYLESMLMKKPIITSDLDFAREICQKAAIYAKPNCPYSYASSIYNLINDPSEQKRLISEGLKQFNTFPVNDDKYRSLLIWFKQIYNHQQNLFKQ